MAGRFDSVRGNEIKSNQIGSYFILNSNQSNMIQQQRHSMRGRKRRIRLLFQVPSSSISLAALLLIISILAVQVQVQVHAAQVQVQITTTVMILLVHIFPSHITTSLSLLPPSFPSSSSSTLSTSTSTSSTRINHDNSNNNNPNIIIPPPTKSTDELSGIPLPIQPIPQLPPPTPCTRICRYNINCYDGNVCIGCFRDTHDISHWSCFSSKEKQYSLEDAADRCHDQQQLQQDQDQDQQMELSSSESSSESLLSSSSSESEPESGTHYYEGSISENELRKQAKMWGQL